MSDIITIVLVALYFLLLVGIGIWASKKIHNMEDYVVAGRSLGFWVFTLLMIGSVCSGMSLLGVSGLGYKFAWPTIWEQIAVPLSIAFCIIFFGVKMYAVAKKSGYITVQDYLAHRFESNTTLRALSALSGIVVSMIYLAGQYTAVSIVLMWLFKIPHLWALLIGAAIVTTYTVIGGLYAVSWTTLIQGIVLIAGVVIMAPIVIMAAGGFTHVNEVMASINPSNVDPWVVGGVFSPEYVVSFFLLLTIGLACAPHVINNVLAVKDIRYFKWAPLIAFVVYGIVMFLLKFSGFAGMSMVKEGMIVLPDVKNASDYIFVAGVEYALPNVFLWGILGVIILAAVMSTTDRLMLTIGTYFSWDIYKKILNPDAPDNQVVRVSQISVFAAAAITLLMAISPPDMLVWLIWAGIGIMFATFAVPLLAGLYWRGATREGAIASMALGLISALFFGALSYFKINLIAMPMHFSFYAFVISVIAMIAISMVTKKTSDKVLDETMTGWYIRK
ncbi:MAG: sodium/solute symporter [Methanoregula sp.]|uniref:sodium:solute symporter family protein n=1 Tax=Methanoregula sp. TaxID=2052170 RepID=UPI0025E19A31|nr:sodium/solute symporter [Methanoregula sp.]MCK9632007.1 sodium/solute symporter [Methanoregula sp.]